MFLIPHPLAVGIPQIPSHNCGRGLMKAFTDSPQTGSEWHIVAVHFLASPRLLRIVRSVLTNTITVPSPFFKLRYQLQIHLKAFLPAIRPELIANAEDKPDESLML
jgi:hypothetical protein